MNKIIGIRQVQHLLICANLHKFHLGDSAYKAYYGNAILNNK